MGLTTDHKRLLKYCQQSFANGFRRTIIKYMSLTPREEILLKTLIDKYISEGSPVGSKYLAKESGLDVSPATIRNVMMDLEKMGLIQAPHTSAGRIPTNKGYRIFVDTLVKTKPVSQKLMQQFEQKFDGDHDPQHVITKASELLSQITNFAGVVMVPGQSQSNFRQIEFLPLSKARILAILVTSDGRVQNRVISVNREFKRSELIEAANYFNHKYSGSSLEKLRKQLLSEMKGHSDEMNRIMTTAMTMANQFFQADEEDNYEDVVLSGEANLFEVPEFGEIEKMRDLFETFKTKHDLLELLDKSLKSSGVQIFIGEESGYIPLNGCSVITAPYELDEECIGVLGVIGPTRMNYADVISVVDMTSRLVSSALTGHLSAADK